MAIRLMVFDMAGTTVNDEDNAVATCVCEAVREAGIDASIEDVNPVMGMPKPLAVAALLGDARGQDPSDEEVERVHADFRERMIRYYRDAPNVRPIDGVEEVFAALRRRGIRIGLDTGFDRPIADAILARLGWDATVIDDSVTSDEVERGRPAPDMIDALMASAGISDSREVGKIGDSVSDIEQGINAECGLVVAVDSPRTRPVLSQYPTIESTSDIRELIGMVDTLDAVQSGVGQ